MAWTATATATFGAALVAVGYVVQITYVHRSRVNKLRKQGVPMPEGWNWFIGHLGALSKYLSKVPSDASVLHAMTEISNEFADTGIFLTDFWPVSPPQLCLFEPEAVAQVLNKSNLPKTQMQAKFTMPITGGPNILDMNGPEWKYWRSIFNPGFSSSAMSDNVSNIVDSVLVFRDKMIEKIGGGMFPLDEMATKLVAEVILKVSLDYDSNHQRTPSPIITSLGRILDWHSFWNPIVLMNPLRPIVQGFCSNTMDRSLRQILAKRFEEIKEERTLTSSASHLQGTKRSKSVVSLAIQAYLEETGSLDKDTLDENFIAYAAAQVRVFLFAGTDSTAATVVYLFHEMAQNPEWREKMKQEHDEVFGPDPMQAAGLLRQDPALLNKCPLSVAFIKETLRLRSPGGTMRDPMDNASVMNVAGIPCAFDVMGVQVLHQTLHKNPRVWPRATEFLPERFLVGPESELYPHHPAAFRPFEQGPRNCIGQTLVWNELKIILILTCRDLVVKDAYADFDAERERQKTILQSIKERVFGEPIKTVNGDRAYQTERTGQYPADGYPCYVGWAKDVPHNQIE